MQKSAKTSKVQIPKGFFIVVFFTLAIACLLFLIGRFNDGQIRSDPQIDEQLDLIFDLKETDHKNRR